MMDPTCSECERLWEAYHSALHSQLIIEYDSHIQSGLDMLVRKASKRCEEARKALDEHEAVHMTATAAANGVA